MTENIFSDFDFTLLDSPDFKEDSVREELILPILKGLGYSITNFVIFVMFKVKVGRTH